MKTFWPRLLATTLVPVALFVLWYVASSDSGNFFFPPLAKILAAFDKVWINAGGFGDIAISLWRLAIGFLASLIFSLVVGVVLGLSKSARDYTEPVFEFFRAIPPNASTVSVCSATWSHVTLWREMPSKLPRTCGRITAEAPAL